MTDSALVFSPGDRITDGEGNVVSGAVLTFFEAGTSNPITVYSDSDLSVPLGTSVTCDASGYPSLSDVRVLIWTGTDPFKLVCKDAVGVTLWTHDAIAGAHDHSGYLTTPSTDITTRLTTVSTTTTWVAADVLNTLFVANPGGGSFVCTLPAPATCTGKSFRVKHVGTSGAVAIRTAGSDLIYTDGIDGARKSVVLMQRGDSVDLVSDGVNWQASAKGYLFAPRAFTVVSQVTSPPPSPSVGAAYLINGVPSGGFTTTSPPCANGDVVVADGLSNWIIYRPSSNCGWTVYDQGTSTLLQYRASAWSDVSASDTTKGLIRLATQAEMEAATDATVAVVPSRLKHHPGVAVARGSFAAGSGTLNAGTGWNISSVSRGSAGTYTVNFTTALSSATYVVLIGTDVSGSYIYSGHRYQSKSTGSFGIVTVGVVAGGGTTVADMSNVDFVVFGDFA